MSDSSSSADVSRDVSSPGGNANDAHTGDATIEASPRGPVTAASDRLLASVSRLDAEALHQPSKCPGWTRAHVVAHVARNADSLINLLTWARTGVPTYQYESADARNADIEAGSARSPEELRHDLEITMNRFAQTVVELPDDAWSAEVRRGPDGNGETIPARRVMWSRLVEVEVHHVDLDVGYSPAHWPSAFVMRLLSETVAGFRVRDDAPAITVDADGHVEVIRPGGPTVTGPAPDVAAWLIGRSDGTGLTSEHPLPNLPTWK